VLCSGGTNKCDSRSKPEAITRCNPGICPTWTAGEWSKVKIKYQRCILFVAPRRSCTLRDKRFCNALFASRRLIFHWVRLTHSSRTVEMHNLHAEVCFLRPTVALPTLNVVTQKLDSKQSLCCSKICRREYLSSEVARVLKNSRPRNSRDYAAHILSLTDFRAKERLLAVY